MVVRDNELTNRIGTRQSLFHPHRRHTPVTSAVDSEFTLLKVFKGALGLHFRMAGIFGIVGITFQRLYDP